MVMVVDGNDVGHTVVIIVVMMVGYNNGWL